MLKNCLALLRAPKRQLGTWLRHQRVQAKFPNARLTYPLSFTIDDLAALSIGVDAGIDAGGEIIVQRESPFSNVAGSLTLGDRVYIGGNCNIRAAGGSITIGDDALIAQQVSLIASNHGIGRETVYRDLPWDEAKTGITIGKNVWLGCNVTVLPGVTIGDNAVVGAGSVVTKSVPGDEVWAGVPARRIKAVDIRNVIDEQVVNQ